MTVVTGGELESEGAQIVGAALVDAFIPGDGDFPAASEVGTAELVATRLLERHGADGMAALLAEVHAHAYNEDRVDLAALAVGDPDSFAALRFAIYLSYYQAPEVIRVLQALGHEYNDAPQPLGYTLPPFDPERQMPVAPRGFYFATEDVQAVNLSGLDDLNLPRVVPGDA